jgi:bacterioferritin (cytochrome b1)
MSNKRTIKALEELVKTEYMAVAALDSALEEADDSKLRKNFKKWRDSHMRQADALNGRLEELGGDPVEYEEGGSGKGQGGLWGRLTGGSQDTSIAGMRLGAERGIKRYIDNLDEIEDAKALNVIRKNLEAKQDEINWYDEQLNKARTDTVETKLAVSTEKVEHIEEASQNGHKKGGMPFPLLVAAGALGAVAYFLLRRSDDDEYDEYGEDAFRYETDEAGSDQVTG